MAIVSGNQMDITLYLVGWDEDEAQISLYFDSEESANDYADDNKDENGNTPNIYSVTATIDFDTMEIA